MATVDLHTQEPEAVVIQEIYVTTTKRLVIDLNLVEVVWDDTNADGVAVGMTPLGPWVHPDSDAELAEIFSKLLEVYGGEVGILMDDITGYNEKGREEVISINVGHWIS